MDTDQNYIDEQQARSQGRRATIFSGFSAISLIMGAAFGPQIAHRMGIPTPVTYTLAGLGGALTLMLNLGADLRGLSRTKYRLATRAYAVVLAALTLLGVAFAIVDAGGFNKQALPSVGLFLFFGTATLLCLHWLCAVLGHPPGEDE